MEQANTIEKYLKILSKYDNYPEKYYRGQLEKYTSIPPSIARDEGYLRNESTLISESIAMKKDEFSMLNSPIERLSKLQHYGIPTRLVDVTIEPLYALYFAVEDTEDLSSGKILVYIANGQDIDSEHIRLLSLVISSSSSVLDEIIVEYNLLYGENLSPQLALEYASNPVFIKHSDRLKNFNPRLHSQHGAFLICANEITGGIITPTLKSLDTISPVTTISIPYEYKKMIKDELDKIYGINNATVYPELPSVANYIKEKYKKNEIEIDGKFSIVETKDIPFGLAKRISIKAVLNTTFTIDQIKLIAIDIINDYKKSNDVVWVDIAKTSSDYVVNNWILQGQWINPSLNERFKPLPLNGKDENGFCWRLADSYAIMSNYYDTFIFEDDIELFIYHDQVFKEFILIFDNLCYSFENDNFTNFKKKVVEYQKELTRLFMTLQNFGRSRNKKFDNFLNIYTNAISPIDDIKYILKNENYKEKSLLYQIQSQFNNSKKHIEFIKKTSPDWENNIGVVDSDYQKFDYRKRKVMEYQYIPTMPISDTAIDVYFNINEVIAEGNTFHIEGNTNLFDGANLMLSFKNGNMLLCQGKAKVFGGKFIFPKFTNNGNGFEPGHYFADISLSLPSVQSKEFTKLSGIEYENLTGKYVNRKGIGPTVNYEFEIDL